MNKTEREFSGRFSLRIPVGLHRDLASAAEAEGSSLNQFICAALAGTVGWRPAAQEKTPNKAPLRGEAAVAEMWRDLLR